MSNILSIRKRLGVSQAALGAAIGCTQGNVGHYERGQTVPPEMARRLIAFAATRGVALSFDDVYAPQGSSANDQKAEAAQQGVA